MGVQVEKLTALVKKTLAALEKVCHGISYVWFLIPVPFYIGLKGAWKNMQTSPEVTDTYFEVMLWMMALLVMALVGLFHRRSHIQFCLAAFVGFVMFLAMGFIGIALQSAPTSFAADHPIPAGLAYSMPLSEREDMEAAVNPLDSTTFLQVRNASQGGIYEYSFFYPSLPEGTIWLQCYEVTENLPLSKRSIKKKSRQEVGGTNHFSQLVKDKEFTVFEGDWGDCFAVRVEVWHKDRKGRKRKLLEKIYGMEGWMR